MTLTGIIIFLLIGAVAGWLAGVIMKGGGFGLVGDIVVGIITDRRLVVRPIGHRRWRTDRINHCRSRRRNHPHRHCPTYQTRVAAELGWPRSTDTRIGSQEILRPLGTQGLF